MSFPVSLYKSYVLENTYPKFYNYAAGITSRWPMILVLELNSGTWRGKHNDMLPCGIYLDKAACVAAIHDILYVICAMSC